MKKLKFLLAIFIVNQTFGQDTLKVKYSKAIEDNSYFIEEAYNQEYRVVQHINNLLFSNKGSRDIVYSFTQEWPFFSQKHQVSYTIGYASLYSGNAKGINDFMLNYRYQLTGHDAYVTLAPRISFILPTGNKSKGLGTGSLGYQFNLPVSKRISEYFVMHANVGYTLLPNVETIGLNNEVYKNLHSNINIGVSTIWLATGKTNVMLEILHNIVREADISNKMTSFRETIISPGFRHAFDIKNLQIVPGLAVPVTLYDSKKDVGLFFYLSLEHPF